MINLANYLGKNLYNVRQVEKMLRQCPSLKRDVGDIPFFWFRKITQENLRVKKQKIFDLFANFALKIYSPQNMPLEKFSRDIEIFRKSLSEILQEKINIEFLGEGAIGKAFKLSIGEKNCTLKLFHQQDKSLQSYTSGHGKGAEILVASYAKANEKVNKFAKFFFGRFARENDNDGFFITDFVTENSARKISSKNIIWERLKSFLYSYDAYRKDNMIGNTVVDYGNLKIHPLLKNKTTRWLVNHLINALEHKNMFMCKNIFEKYKNTKFLEQANLYLKEALSYEKNISSEIKSYLEMFNTLSK